MPVAKNTPPPANRRPRKPSDVLELIAACVGIHPAAEQRECEEIEWLESLPRAASIRVRRHTCDCQPVVYELCQAGGLMFVRRYDRSDGVLIEESEWLRPPAAEHLWTRILLGQAR
ncbi:hypothetical protein FLX08_39735 [Microbispora hainanensis]|uniref:Uncharacterized protein n=1 Tax=Microbispora hainanensis TaxID=568844 RepID=A0A544XLM2_9ACTN|nr:hypothetical protein FLX08_39735 [Microbispora hainanensis]